MKKIFLGFFLLSLTSACTHSIHVAHVSDFSPTFQSLNKGQMIQAKAEQKVVLGFAFETNYVNQAYASLQSACQNGNIQGIFTQYSTSHGLFSWTNTVHMQGVCIK